MLHIFKTFNSKQVSVDDADYAYDDQGSGLGVYRTTRPTKEMTEDTMVNLINEETTTSGLCCFSPN